MRTYLHSFRLFRSRLSFGCWLRLGAAAALGAPFAASAQVIEISEDGVAIVLGSAVEPVQVDGKRSTVSIESSGADAFASAARRHGLDINLLRAVAWTESRGRNDAISPKGAIGIMQLMPATAASLGVDPHNPIANIEGGAIYLAKQIATFGTISLALAAYNAGPAAVIRHRGVPPYAETRAYVSGILRRLNGSEAVPQRQLSGPTAAREAPQTKKFPDLLIEVPNT